jgi:hypothetical protein
MTMVRARQHLQSTTCDPWWLTSAFTSYTFYMPPLDAFRVLVSCMDSFLKKPESYVRQD